MAEMDRILIENWNRTVNPDDEIYIYESALKEAEDESLFIDDFNEPALALVYYDTETENISFEGE